MWNKCKNNSELRSRDGMQHAKNHGNQEIPLASVKIIELNEWRCRDVMHQVKNRGNKEIPLALLSRKLPQSCVNPPYIIQAKGYA